VPDPEQYGQFITVDRIKAQQGLPTISIESRLTRDLSELLLLVRKGCAFDVQLHAGQCEDPRDFNGGWEKIYVLEAAEATSYDTADFGALDADQEAVVNETVPMTGQNWYEIKRIAGGEVAASDVVQEVVDVIICDSRQCGACGISSNGCEKIFAVSKNTAGSPGLGAQVLYSGDGGSLWGSTVVTTLGASDDPSALACSGIYLVVASLESESVHIAPLADILLGVETWTEVTTGFVAAHGPNAIFTLGSTFNWLVGNGGYIYFSDDIGSGVSVQSAGGQTVQNLLAISGSDELNLVAVGASNTILFTNNGGDTWSSITGPAIGEDITSVAVKSPTVWIVGTSAGNLFYTGDGGATWTAKLFPGSGSGVVQDIQFSNGTVGYLSHTTSGGVGRILRTIDGGFSWYVLPEAAGLSLPDNDKIDALAACTEDVNLVFGAGLGANATDGILIKVA
jgi:photosystem II stability/assembly factor-like uncharacterized protein